MLFPDDESLYASMTITNTNSATTNCYKGHITVSLHIAVNLLF